MIQIKSISEKLWKMLDDVKLQLSINRLSILIFILLDEFCELSGNYNSKKKFKSMKVEFSIFKLTISIFTDDVK